MTRKHVVIKVWCFDVNHEMVLDQLERLLNSFLADKGIESNEVGKFVLNLELPANSIAQWAQRIKTEIPYSHGHEIESVTDL